jgi:hypothetical protein
MPVQQSGDDEMTAIKMLSNAGKKKGISDKYERIRRILSRDCL